MVLAAAFVAIMLIVGACSEPTKKDAGTSHASDPASGEMDCTDAPSVIGCAPSGSMLDRYLPKEPTKATGSPILIGTINQETGAAGAFPELTVADKVAIDFINTELDGVDGHPIELVVCNTNFSPDLSQSCAQEMVSKKVAAVIGGIDIWGTGIKTLENNGIPYVGGIPISFDAARSDVSFQFSGGTWGGVLGMGKYAMDELDAKKIAIIHGDFGPITDAAQLGKAALDKRGAEVTLIGVSAVNADMVTALNQAAQGDPDVVIALVADSGCKPTMLTAQQLDFKAPIMYTGACVAPKILDAVGTAAEGAIFNLEAELGDENPDNLVYRAIAQKYGPKHGYESQSAGSVSFRATINLYAALRDLGVEKATPAEILRYFRATKDAPSFFGHAYTCDGEQLPGYPAMCAPQQSLGVLKDGELVRLSDWIDVRPLAT